jgi:GTP cyclohydrolase I
MLGLDPDELQPSQICNLESPAKDTTAAAQPSQQLALVHHGRSSSVCSRASPCRLASMDTLPTAPATPDPSEGDSDLMSEKGSESESDAGLLCLCMDEPAGAADCGALRGRSTGVLHHPSCTAGGSSSTSSSSSTAGASDPGRSRIMQHLLYDSSSFCTKAISLPDMSALQCSSPCAGGDSKAHREITATALPGVGGTTCSCLGTGHTCGSASPRSPLDQRVHSMEQAALTLATAMLRGSSGATLFHSAPHVLEAAAQNYVASLLASTSGYVAKLPTAVAASAGNSSSSTAGSVSKSSCPCCSSSSSSSLPHALQLSSGAPAATTTPSAGSPAGTAYAATLPFNSQCEHHMLPFYGSLTVVYYTESCSRCCTNSSSADSGPHQQCTGGASHLECTARTACSASTPLVPPQAVQEALQQIVHAFTQRLQVQERITHQVADAAAQLLMGSRRVAGQHNHKAQQQRQGENQEDEGGMVSSVVVVVDAAHMCMVARGVENHAGRTTTIAARGRAAEDAKLRTQALRIARAACQS